MKISTAKSALIISGLFLVAGYAGITFHELWRDEIQAWSIALNSHSITDLFNNSRYEGHPKLWFLLLFFLTRISEDVFYMQLLHIFISTLAVLTFAYFSPFGFTKNILICFGYFFAYEYSVISRNYAIECLLLFLAAGLFIKYGQRKLILISLLLFLLMQTNVYAVIIAMLFYTFILFSFKHLGKLTPVLMLGSLSIFLLGLIISVVSLIPPSDTGFAPSWNTELNLKHAVQVMNTVFTSYSPVPRIQAGFWNTNILDSIAGSTEIKFLLSVLILIAAGILFKKNKRILLLYYSGTAAVLLFTYVKYFGYSRHHGHLFLIFILCCVLHFSGTYGNQTYEYDSQSKIGAFVQKYFLSLVLLLQLAAFIISFSGDLKYPFSNSKRAAEFIRPLINTAAIVIGDDNAPASAVAGLLQQDFYYPKTKQAGKYIVWNSTRILKSEEELVSAVKDVSANLDKEALAVLSYSLTKKPDNWILLNSFEGAIVFNENYFIYKIIPEPKTLND